MRLDYASKITYVRQLKNKGTTTATYDVEMESVEASATVRSTFGAFFKGRKAGKAVTPLPAELTKISINNSHTFTTRVRVRIMKQLAICHQAANPDFACFVTSYLPRPALRIKPPGGKVDTYQFVEAVRRFSHYLTPDFLKTETTYAKGVGLDKLISTFIVLNPDLILPPITLTPGPNPTSKRTADQMEDKQSSTAPAKKGRGKGKAKSKGPGKGQGKDRDQVKGKVSFSQGPSTRSGQASVAGSSVTISNRFESLASPAPMLDTSFQGQTNVESEKQKKPPETVDNEQMSEESSSEEDAV